MSLLSKKLNVQIGNEITNTKGVVFCARNEVTVFNCKVDYVEQALNDAGYYDTDGDYTEEDLHLLSEIVDQFGSQQMNYNQVFEKDIWFDEKLFNL